MRGNCMMPSIKASNFKVCALQGLRVACMSAYNFKRQSIYVACYA